MEVSHYENLLGREQNQAKKRLHNSRKARSTTDQYHLKMYKDQNTPEFVDSSDQQEARI